jgi:hypothetical protein
LSNHGGLVARDALHDDVCSVGHDGRVDTPEQLDGRERLDAIVADELSDAGVDQGRMFSTIGWRRGGKVFAFVGRSGELMIKIPEDRVRALVDAGVGEPMSIRERTMREWVRIRESADWAPLVVEAYAFGGRDLPR